MPRATATRFSPLRRFAAMLAVALVLVLDVLAVCPEAHEFFHHDADAAEHECVVTHFLHGSTTPVDFCPLVVGPVLVGENEPRLAAVVVLPAAPSFLHPPGCGPPAV